MVSVEKIGRGCKSQVVFADRGFFMVERIREWRVFWFRAIIAVISSIVGVIILGVAILGAAILGAA